MVGRSATSGRIFEKPLFITYTLGAPACAVNRIFFGKLPSLAAERRAILDREPAKRTSWDHPSGNRYSVLGMRLLP